VKAGVKITLEFSFKKGVLTLSDRQGWVQVKEYGSFNKDLLYSLGALVFINCTQSWPLYKPQGPS